MMLILLVILLIDRINGRCLPDKVELNIAPNALCTPCVYFGSAAIAVSTDKVSFYQSMVQIGVNYLQMQEDVILSGLDNYWLSIEKTLTTTSLSAAEICNVMLDCGYPEPEKLNWQISLPKTVKPKVKTPKLPELGKPRLKILHLADLHMDLDYKIGSVSNCDKYLCCRENSQTVSSDNPVVSAGFWGSGELCDLPLWTIRAMFDYINKTEKFDFIYWTGDLTPHNVWESNRDEHLELLELLSNLFKEYFPNKVVYASLGNHEAHPSNLFPLEDNIYDNSSWLYDTIADYWVQNGLPQDLAKNITRGAFYTTLISENTRLISLNTNYCYKLNFWLLNNSRDPFDQLAWLIDVLQISEDYGEKVHIISHISPGYECMESFSKAYYQIVNRYENVITGQFFGHAHTDEVEIFYDLQNLKRPVNVAYSSPSASTYFTPNSAYRIYSVDGLYPETTFQVLNYETKVLDMAKANAENVTEWVKEYDAKSAYRMPALFPKDWDYVVNEMIEEPNGTKANNYIKFYHKSSSLADNCYGACRLNILCLAKQARSDNFIPCNDAT